MYVSLTWCLMLPFVIQASSWAGYFFLILLFVDTLTTSESPTVTTGTPLAVTTGTPLTVTTSAPSPGPLKVHFSGNTPHVVENTVTVQVFANKPASAICRLGHATPLPCKQFPQCHNITFCTQRILNTLYFIMHDAVFFTMGSAKHSNPCYHTHSFLHTSSSPTVAWQPQIQHTSCLYSACAV